MDAIYTAFLLILMLINVLIASLKTGWALPAAIGLLNVSIAAAALGTDIGNDIYFSPWTQTMVLVVAIFTIYGTFRSNSGK